MLVLWLLLLVPVCSAFFSFEEDRELRNTCGREMPSAMKASVYKVLLGDPVEPNEYPFIAAVALKNPKRAKWQKLMDRYSTRPASNEMYWRKVEFSDMKRHCTGVLISKRHVLTAAHCVVEALIEEEEQEELCRRYGVIIGDKMIGRYYRKPKDFTIYAGSRCPKPGACTPNRTEYEVAGISVHLDYNICMFTADLAILELSRDVERSDAIPVCLPEIYTPLPQELKAAGYGYDPHAENQEEPGLQEVSLYHFREMNGIIAAKDQYVDTCRGDSGGPLFSRRMGRFTLFGITSSGPPCKMPLRVREGYYVDVRKYLQWICDNSGVCTTLMK